MMGWLASIRNADEARQVLAAGADIVDAKNPNAGALGALTLDTVSSIVKAVKGESLVSATIGDFPDMEPHAVSLAASMMASTGVNIVKVGLFPAPTLHHCLNALGSLCGQYRLVAVLFADKNPDISLVHLLAKLGFYGVMLDTMDKSAGGLLKHQPIEHLAEFIIQARRVKLITGLAGSLRAKDIPVLATLSPDYLGFRGALCHNHTRADTLDRNAVSVIAQTMTGCMGHSKHQPDHHFVSDQSRR